MSPQLVLLSSSRVLAAVFVVAVSVLLLLFRPMCTCDMQDTYLTESLDGSGAGGAFWPSRAGTVLMLLSSFLPSIPEFIISCLCNYVLCGRYQKSQISLRYR